jgi:hypothetical protein
MQPCSSCDSLLPPDQKTRKHLRPRKCPTCVAERAKERRSEPVKLLKHRWNGACRRLYPDCDKEMWSDKTVEHVFERFEGKSVISGEDNPELLCVFAFFKSTNEPPTRDQLVLVTSREAQSIAREKTQEKRAQRFPQKIQDEMMATLKKE